MKMLISALLLSCLTLTGCSTLNEEFDCPAPKGGSCKRMDQIYDMVNGENGVGQERLAVAPNKNPLMVATGQGEPRRYGEGVMRLWIAPYEDTDGNYHQANQIYSVVREGQWHQNQADASK